jgi:hypothetical protein
VSSALAIASVTAVMKNLLDNGVINDDVATSVGTVTVSALAPDLVPVDNNAASRLNLFLYQVTPNPGWRNAGLPSRSGAGDRLSNPPLALDLHYFLTAYASRDLHAEILLGYGMQILHETPVLARQGIRRALESLCAKVTRIGEKANVEFRAQMLNAFNLTKEDADVLNPWLTLLSFGLLLWQFVAAWRFPMHRRVVDESFAPPVVLLKPLKGCDEHTETCLRSWFTQEYSGEIQILFGIASADDPGAVLRHPVRR